jgi:hypothetical protein
MRVFEIPAQRLRSGEGLGDLELSPTRLVSYKVTDEAGKPVVGAFVAAVDGEARIWSVSLQDGCGVIEVPLGDVELIAGSFGFRSTTVLAAEFLAGELPIVLDAASVLSVHVKSQDGGRLTNGVEICIQSDRPLFEGDPRTWWEWPRSETIVLPSNVRTGDDPEKLIVLESTTAKLSSVRPDARVQITARDPLSGAQASQSIVLAEREARTIELRLPRKPRTVRGRVSAADGTPVYRGLPRLMPLSRSDDVIIDGDTARDGTFLFEDVLADRALLYVEGTSWIKELSIPEDGLYVDVRLEADQEAAVEVLDDQDRPVSSAEVFFRSGAFLARESTDDEGKVRAHPVPSGEVLIEARYGNVDASLTARVPGPTAVLHLPPHGAVELEGWSNLRTIRLEPIGAMKAIESKDGQTSMRGIGPGRYRARIDCWTDDEMKDSVPVAEREIVVKNGETTTIRSKE